MKRVNASKKVTKTSLTLSYLLYDIEMLFEKKMVQAFSLQKYRKGEPGYKWVTFFLKE